MANDELDPDFDGRTLGRYRPEITELLLGIAADVIRSFGSAFGGRHLAIIGGLVPTLLVPDPSPEIAPHVGTGDIDLHVSLHLMDGETADYYQSIIEGFQKLGLEPGSRNGRGAPWRWTATYREVHVVVDLLCPARQDGGVPERPAPDTVAEHNIGPSAEISAIGVGFGHLVPIDCVKITRRVETAGGKLNYDFPVAGVTSWLCLKADGIRFRDKPKDSFDVVWLIEAIGPEIAAERIAHSPILQGEHADAALDQIRRLVDDQYLDVDSIGPGQYAIFVERPGDPQAKQRAQAAIGTFARELRRLHVL